MNPVQLPSSATFVAATLCFGASLQMVACLARPPHQSEVSAPTKRPAPAAARATPPGAQSTAKLDAWSAVERMGLGINIGNTLDNTTRWETGWGNPPITRAFVEHLAGLGFKTVRLPVAWDTYAVAGRIQSDKLQRVGQVVDWITSAGMFCVLDIHWDGGWIDSSWKEHYRDTYATFSPEAERKYRSYWKQIARFFRDKDEKLVFEALNEETNFTNEGSVRQAYATLTRVHQIFIDTVRSSGGYNSKRLLIVAGYATDITQTCNDDYQLPRDTIPGHLLVSVHYYTPWQFCGMTKTKSWGRVMHTWGNARDAAEMNKLLDMMAAFSSRNDVPTFIGEFAVEPKKESASRVRWMAALVKGAFARKMVPVLWDSGHEVSRREPYAASADLRRVLAEVLPPGKAAP